MISPFTIHVLHHGGDCQDGGLRWLRNIGTCLSGYAASYIIYKKRVYDHPGSMHKESGRICIRPHPVENIYLNTVFGSHIFSHAVAANCPRLVKFSVCVGVCVCGTRVPRVFSQYDRDTLLASLLLVRSVFCISSVVGDWLSGK